MRGFAAIGLHRPKTAVNVGSVLRAAMCYNASCIAISGDRINGREIRSAANTTQTQRHIPVFRGELRDLIPYAAVPVAVDLVDDAEPLHSFTHPHSAFYIFGPEDGTLGREILSWCPRRVMVPTRFCMNLAATVNVVLYDRLAKQMMRAAQAIEARSGETRQRLDPKDESAVGEADAPNHDILKGDAGQPNKRGATSHDRDNNASGKGIE